MIGSGIVDVDIHGMTAQQAHAHIDSVLSKANASVYIVRVIHGYHGGTSLRTMLWDEYSYQRHPKVVRVQGGNNPGITELILRELV